MSKKQLQGNLLASSEMQTFSEPPSMRLLRTAAALFHEDLTPETVEVWKKHLSSFPSAAIEYAFDNWNRNGQFFPKPVDISQLVQAWREEQFDPSSFKYEPTGWGEPQVIALWHLYHQRYPEEIKRGERLSEAQWQQMMDEIQKRSRAA